VAYRDPKQQNDIAKAKARALMRLQRTHLEEYWTYYDSEMLKLGYERIPGRPRGKRNGFRKLTEPRLTVTPHPATLEIRGGDTIISVYGVTAVAEWCGVTPAAVSNWLERHTGYPIPRVRVITATGSVFGWGLDQKKAWRTFQANRIAGRPAVKP
jgi:hypothetical protein